MLAANSVRESEDQPRRVWVKATESERWQSTCAREPLIRLRTCGVVLVRFRHSPLNGTMVVLPRGPSQDTMPEP